MKRYILIASLLTLSTGCTQYKKVFGIGDDAAAADIPPCASVAPLNLGLSDTDTLAALTFDQKNRLDNQSTFFDSRVPSLQEVRDLYTGARVFPTAAGEWYCLDQSEFRRAVEASNNLGRFPL